VPTCDVELDARLNGLACTQAPSGYQRWTVRLLADKLVEVKIADSVSTMTVLRSLKNELRPRLSKYWKIPPDHDAAFVAAMEDVLEVYRLPHDPRYPVVCMDEPSKQLVDEVAAVICGEPAVDREFRPWVFSRRWICKGD